jgi:CDP-diacylglycerol--glycerol-3-phosphate 3-phosphatidyltransferase
LPVSTRRRDALCRHLPNLLSLTRIVGTAPLLIAAIVAGSRPWFFGLLCTAWLTDALDGFLARRLHTESDQGRMLDSWGDYVTTAPCVAGLCWLWPELVAREWRWFAVGVTAFFAVVVYGLVRHGRPPGYHTWLAKVLAVALPFVLAALLTGWSARPFHWLIVWQVVGAVEELAISLLLPGFSGEMPSARHAWHRRGRNQSR